MRRLSASSLLAHEGDEVGTLLFLLDPCENHFRARDVLLRVDQILKHVLVRPMDGRVLVRLRVSEALAGPRCPPHDSPQRRALLGIAALLDGVALSTLGLEELRALFH